KSLRRTRRRQDGVSPQGSSGLPFSWPRGCPSRGGERLCQDGTRQLALGPPARSFSPSARRSALDSVALPHRRHTELREMAAERAPALGRELAADALVAVEHEHERMAAQRAVEVGRADVLERDLEVAARSSAFIANDSVSDLDRNALPRPEARADHRRE